ncbi:hypothetical protein ASC95_06535 [Pelomonas sp. Root1217]|uniref:DUF3455 domain-containing protein n=1 Tax=Pelomonas sp. Root1217 TaxID=1736430 RepID=UPI00070BD664|nr:DUF3455 domain-containing protein [Pelomonas sp. Root1217]KQV61065.1 hypothetical protein ASC95_06535 [Pelomonas sp. Root1217]
MRVVFALSPVLMLAACASAPQPPQAPANLQPPAGQTFVMEALASGVQIYDCAAKADGSGPGWVFRAPEATLADQRSNPLGKHYAGPTWEAPDGSRVVGEVKARAPSPTPETAIPWLLLAAKSNSGSGVFANVRSIQRLNTGGGVEPAEHCTTEKLGQQARVAYTAAYYFYR